MKLSDHFKDTEFFSNETYIELSQAGRDPSWYIPALLLYDLETIRLHFNKPLRITSGFRTYEENKLVSKSPLSCHTLGLAVDFKIDGITPQEVQEWCKKKFNYGALGCYETFTHRDVRHTKNKLIIWEG